MAKHNPEKKTWMMAGLGVLALGLVGVAVMQSQGGEDEAEGKAKGDGSGGSKEKAIKAVKSNLAKKGKDPESYQLQARPAQAGGFDVMATSATGKVFKFGVDTKGKVRLKSGAGAGGGSGEEASAGTPLPQSNLSTGQPAPITSVARPVR